MTAGDQILKLKNDGNSFFKANNLNAAVSCYNKALKLLSAGNVPDSGSEKDTATLKATLYNNRSAVHLKNLDFQAAEKDASKVLEITPADSKALFRRSQALEKMSKFSEAFKDAKLALHYDPKNTAINQTLQRLASIVQEKQKEAITTEHRMKSMFELCFNKDEGIEKRTQAMNNLLVLSRDNAGASMILDAGGVKKILDVIKLESDTELILSAYRTLDQLASEEFRALKILQAYTVENVVRLLNQSDGQLVDAGASLVQRCFNALASMNPKEMKKPDEEKVEKNKLVLIDLIFELKRLLTDPNIGVLPRIASIDLLLKNLMHMDHGLPRGWSVRFIENDGLDRLLQVSCNIPQQFTLPVNFETREHVAICMARLYDDMVFDQHRATYRDVVEKFGAKLMDQNPLTNERRVQIISCLTTLLQGPFEIGISLVTNNAITNMMLQMAASEIELLQMVAAEAIVQTASKKERCSAIIASGIPILKKLYDSSNDNIKARALVGLCKCASSGGSDASSRPMADGSTIKLTQACKKFLLSASRDSDVKKWASEGLSYLTLDADVKELVVEDAALIRALVELAKQSGAMCVFGMASIFVNLTNSYDRPTVEPELVKLAQFAKHHVPEQHAKDSPEFVRNRVDRLVVEGAVSACVAISNTESAQCREMLARALCAFTLEKDHRGVVVKEGGAKLLIKLALGNTTDAGKIQAAHGLARIGVTINPEISFPGQRCYEVIRPLISLLHVDRSAIQNYEALLALTNLSSISDSVRKRMFKEKIIPCVEEFWFTQDHSELRAAAAELLLNLLHCEEVFELVSAPGTDRLKLWFLYSAEEDDNRLCQCSSAGLVLLTEKVENCKRIVKEVGKWAEIFKEIITRDDVIVQQRGMMALANLMEADYDVAANIVKTDLIDYLIAISKLDDKTREKSAQAATRAILAAEKFELIRPSDRELYERQHNISTVPKNP